METAVLVALVMSIVQVIKKWPIIDKIPAVALTVIVSILVVAYKALETGGVGAFGIELLVKLILVIIAANGTYRVLKVAGTATS